MEIKFSDDIVHMCGMNLNMCILRMLDDTFSLGAAHMVRSDMAYIHVGLDKIGIKTNIFSLISSQKTHVCSY